MGARPQGLSTFMWDGRDAAGNVMPKGPYAISVVTTDANGGAVSVSQETTGVVSSVSFDQGYPVLQLDNGVSVPVSDLLRVKT
jgi:flagellar basal-body rod modification protein FlgD